MGVDKLAAEARPLVEDDRGEAGASAELRGSRQAERSERTRTALLESAERVFARDGFEAARIEDIACEAGRSRGAFYANFENKLEVFLELRSRLIRQRAREIRALVEPVAAAERTQAVHQYLMRELGNRERWLLQVEFKLFAVRHPEMRAALAERHLETAISINMEELSELFPEKAHGTAEMRQNTYAFEALMEGFAVNAVFHPEAVTPVYLERVVPALLAVIFEAGSRKQEIGSRK